MRMKCIAISFFILLFGAWLAGLPKHSSAAEPAAQLEVQLVSDQDVIASGGKASFHLIYHNVQNRSLSNVQLKLLISDGFEAADVSGAEWDSVNRSIVWKIKNVESNGASVIHFQLKVKDQVKVNDLLQVSSYVAVNSEDFVKIGEVKVKAGTEIHDPFFVGYPDGTFRPTSFITRAETATVVSKIKHLTDMTPLKKAYKDVNSRHWAHDAILKVANAGYMKGSPDGYFRPDEPISRAEFVSLVLQIRNIHPVPLPGFGDTVGHWAQDWIGTAKSLGFVKGNHLNLFAPDLWIERQSAAMLLDIALLRGPLHDGKTKVIQHFPDVLPSSWAFGWIEEASVIAHESERTIASGEKLIRYIE